MSGKKCLVLSILLAAVLTGCGGRMNYAAVNTPATEPLTPSQTSTNFTQTPTTNNSTTNSNYTSSNPYTQGTQTSIAQGALEIKDVTKDTKGVLLWKKLIVKGRVYNSSSSPLSATLQVVFTKNNVVGGTQTKEISNLSPGQSLSFEFTSTESADTAELTIVGQR
ncbi:MAG: FxLYD domain-containing protein [Bacteroidota bacterium]